MSEDEELTDDGLRRLQDRTLGQVEDEQNGTPPLGRVQSVVAMTLAEALKQGLSIGEMAEVADALRDHVEEARFAVVDLFARMQCQLPFVPGRHNRSATRTATYREILRMNGFTVAEGKALSELISHAVGSTGR